MFMPASASVGFSVAAAAEQKDYDNPNPFASAAAKAAETAAHTASRVASVVLAAAAAAKQNKYYNDFKAASAAITVVSKKHGSLPPLKNLPGYSVFILCILHKFSVRKFIKSLIFGLRG